jgi:hypothetical protein
MKHHAPVRPIGKCKGCCLNMRTFCAAGLEPKAQWSKGRCKSLNDQSLLEAYLHRPPPSGAKAAKLSRRAKAAHMNTVPHFDGQVFLPARRGRAVPPGGC